VIEVKVATSGLRVEALSLKPAITRLIGELADYAERTMREEAPKRTGALRKSIRKAVSSMEAEIGSQVPYAVYVEYGTRPHIITPVKARALRFEVGKEIVFTRLVQHPGAKPNPFVRRTAEKTTRRVSSTWTSLWEAVIRGLL